MVTKKLDPNDFKHKDLYRQAREKYGDKGQMDITIEECAELIKAISKLHRASANGKLSDEIKDNFLEELVDIQIMFEQMTLMYEDKWGPISEKFDKKKEIQIGRLKNRLSKTDEY